MADVTARIDPTKLQLDANGEIAPKQMYDGTGALSTGLRSLGNAISSGLDTVKSWGRSNQSELAGTDTGVWNLPGVAVQRNSGGDGVYGTPDPVVVAPTTVSSHTPGGVKFAATPSAALPTTQVTPTAKTAAPVAASTVVPAVPYDAAPAQTANDRIFELTQNAPGGLGGGFLDSNVTQPVALDATGIKDYALGANGVLPLTATKLLYSLNAPRMSQRRIRQFRTSGGSPGFPPLLSICLQGLKERGQPTRISKTVSPRCLRI